MDSSAQSKVGQKVGQYSPPSELALDIGKKTVNT